MLVPNSACERKRLTMSSAFKSVLAGLVLVCGFQIAAAQTGPPTAGTAETRTNDSATLTKPSGPDTRYRIGPGDVLDVRVARAPELSRDAVRVDQGGNIRMPMLDEEIPAACLTEAELAQSIAKLYRKYKNNP